MDRDGEAKNNDTTEQSSDQDDSEDETQSINGEVNHDGDDENDDAPSDSDIGGDVTNGDQNAKDAETKNETNADSKTGRFTGFFKKLSNKKSTDDGAKNETDANLNVDVVQPEKNNEVKENELEDSGKEIVEGEVKKRVSFLQKIGLKKKSLETVSNNEDKKDEDESSNAR